jgi:hydroxymethylglutaryl-CoA lyase
MRERFDEVSVFLSASETHNRHNVNRSVADSQAGLEPTLRRAGEAGLRREGVIATSFGCPYEGEVPLERVFEIAEALAAAGCEEVGFGDPCLRAFGPFTVPLGQATLGTCRAPF